MPKEQVQEPEERLTVRASKEYFLLKWDFLVSGMILTPIIYFASDQRVLAVCLESVLVLVSLYLFWGVPHIKLKLSEQYCCYTDSLGRKHEFWMEDVYDVKKVFGRGGAFIWVLRDIYGKEIIRFNPKMLENMNKIVTFIRVHKNKCN